MVYSYVSCRADYSPAKTFMILPPSEQVNNLKEAEEFASATGWQMLAEYEEAVLLVYVPEDGYKGLSLSLPGEILQEKRNDFDSLNGRSLSQRGGKLWCWESMVYLAGYEDGAEYGGNCLIAEPGRFAAAALIGGAPSDFSKGNELSIHPFLKDVSEDYKTVNHDIESRIWLYTDDAEKAERTGEYFSRDGELQVKSLPEKYDLLLSAEILKGLFNKVIRWKDGPDGTVYDISSREEFYHGGEFIQESITVGITDYPVAVHLPKGKSCEEVQGLALVILLHGRGEPAWLFAAKNGWDELSDTTGEFVLAIPDSPGNIWHPERDRDAFPAMIELLCSKYRLDRGRVYLTGFSNGAMMTREAGSIYPELFAALAPWNGPVHLKKEFDNPVFFSKLRDEGYRMPVWIAVGDKDPAASTDSLKEQLEYMLSANDCIMTEADNKYGYEPGEIKHHGRFETAIFARKDGGEPLVYVTIMKDMPHGAIREESRVCYEFMRRFRRDKGSRTIC